MSKRPLIIALALGAACAPACGGPGPNPLSGGVGGGDPSTGALGIMLPPPRLVATAGVTIKEIALYQAVKRPLMAGGMAATSDIPIVAGRDALLRVFVDVDMSHVLTGRVFFDDGGAPIEVKQTIAMSSTDAKLDSTLDFDIPGARITPNTKYHVAVGEIEAEPTENALAPTYPAMGSDPMPGESIGATLKIMLAPISYKGSVASLTPKRIQEYTDGFRAMYPAPTVVVTVRDKPIVWTQTVGANGQGWSELLDHVAQTRVSDKTPPDVYYFAPFAPTASFGQFCGGGCVAGLGLLGTGNDSFSRAAIGLGYEGDADGIITAVHETGHNHGRTHAPCQVPDPDPQYPHKGGVDGVWGYNFVTKQLFPPTITDMMGYCTPVWISDYTFKGLFNRIKIVNGVQRVEIPEALRNRMYDRALVNADGTLQWLPSMRLDEPPTTEDQQAIVVESEGVAETTKASFYRFDHLAGGIAVWPATERPIQAVRIEVAPGKTVRLER
ncbi:MAG: hypothetical protein ABJE95_38185 [Byssovorax sp.]